MNSDAAEVKALIATASVCDDCLAHKIGSTARHVGGILNQIAAAAKLTTTSGRCDSCLKQTVVHRLG